MAPSVIVEIGAALCCCLPCLQLRPAKQGTVASSAQKSSRSMKWLSDWHEHPTLKEYRLREHLADGGFSEIWLADHLPSGEQRVVKVVYLRKPGLRPEDAEVLRGEARWLRNLEHPHLLHCFDVFETRFHMVMVLEYLAGGEMLHHLHKVAHYSEAEAARLFAQVVSAVAYLHNLSIVHRDIKPENIMFARRVEDCVARGKALRVKLIDLGMAAVLHTPGADTLPHSSCTTTKASRGWAKAFRALSGGGSGRRVGSFSVGRSGSSTARRRSVTRQPLTGCLGSPGFIAPEVVKGGVHTPAMDVYSLGVLLFIMLTGRKPWALRDVRSFQYAYKRLAEAPGLQDPSFLALSSTARSLLLSMLADDPAARPSAAAVLRHPFLTQCLAVSGHAAGSLTRRHGHVHQVDAALHDNIRRRIAQLASLRRFRGLAFAMMAGRQEGDPQHAGEFLREVEERRKALHRDIVTRGKNRRAAAAAADVAGQDPHQAALRTTAVVAAAEPTADQEGRSRRNSTDSNGSQRPLLDSQQHLQKPEHEVEGPARLSFTSQGGNRSSPTDTATGSMDQDRRRSRVGRLDGHMGAAGTAGVQDEERQALLHDASHHGTRDNAEGRGGGQGSQRGRDGRGHCGSAGQPLLPHGVGKSDADCQRYYQQQHGSPGRNSHALHPEGQGAQCQRLDCSASPGHCGSARGAAAGPTRTTGAGTQVGLAAAAAASGAAGSYPGLPPRPAPAGPVSGARGTGHGAPVRTAAVGSAGTSAARGAPGSPAAPPQSAAPASSLSRGWSSTLRKEVVACAYPAGHGVANGGAAAAPGRPPQRRPGHSRSKSDGRVLPDAIQSGATLPFDGAVAGGWDEDTAGEVEVEVRRSRRDVNGKGRASMRRGGASQLELAALDPLALIRELPASSTRACGAAPGVRLNLGRAHSAPESLAVVGAGCGLLLEAEQLGSGSGAGGGGPQGVGAGSSAAEELGMMERAVLGADMRAFSASSWTLELLENETLLAALTGMDLRLRGRVSSSGYDMDASVYDGSVYDGTVYSGTAYGAAAAAILQSGGGSTEVNGPQASGAAAAARSGSGETGRTGPGGQVAVTPAALRRLASGLSARAASLDTDGTVHASSQAAALLAAAAAAAASLAGSRSARRISGAGGSGVPLEGSGGGAVPPQRLSTEVVQQLLGRSGARVSLESSAHRAPQRYSLEARTHGSAGGANATVAAAAAVLQRLAAAAAAAAGPLTPTRSSSLWPNMHPTGAAAGVGVIDAGAGGGSGGGVHALWGQRSSRELLQAGRHHPAQAMPGALPRQAGSGTLEDSSYYGSTASRESPMPTPLPTPTADRSAHAFGSLEPVALPLPLFRSGASTRGTDSSYHNTYHAYPAIDATDLPHPIWRAAQQQQEDPSHGSTHPREPHSSFQLDHILPHHLASYSSDTTPPQPRALLHYPSLRASPADAALPDPELLAALAATVPGLPTPPSAATGFTAALSSMGPSPGLLIPGSGALGFRLNLAVPHLDDCVAAVRERGNSLDETLHGANAVWAQLHAMRSGALQSPPGGSGTVAGVGVVPGGGQAAGGATGAVASPGVQWDAAGSVVHGAAGARQGGGAAGRSSAVRVSLQLARVDEAAEDSGDSTGGPTGACTGRQGPRGGGRRGGQGTAPGTCLQGQVASASPAGAAAASHAALGKEPGGKGDGEGPSASVEMVRREVGMTTHKQGDAGAGAGGPASEQGKGQEQQSRLPPLRTRLRSAFENVGRMPAPPSPFSSQAALGWDAIS